MANSLAPDVSALLDMLAAGPQLAFRDLPVADARAAVVQMAAAFDAPADPSVSAVDSELKAGGNSIRLRCYTPPQSAGAGPVILYIHGGGWVVGGIDAYDSFCRLLAQRSGLRVASVDYRLAPETRFPGAYDDALSAAKWLLAGNSPFGTTDGLVLAGDSAGGGIAAALGAEAEELTPKLWGLLLFYPVLDVSRRTASYAAFAEGHLLQATDMAYFIDSYLPDKASRTDPRCSPLLGHNIAQLPSVALLTCSHDVLRDEGHAYAAALRAAGVPLNHIEAPGHIHGLVTLRQAIPSGIPLLEQIIDKMKETVKNRSETP